MVRAHWESEPGPQTRALHDRMRVFVGQQIPLIDKFFGPPSAIYLDPRSADTQVRRYDCTDGTIYVRIWIKSGKGFMSRHDAGNVRSIHAYPLVNPVLH